MSARGYKHSGDSFCYVCGEFSARSKKHCLSNCIRAGETYFAYFGMPVDDQIYVGHYMSSVTTVVALLKVGQEEKKSYMFCYLPYLA